jgi:zinc transport system substrate-binding protein
MILITDMVSPMKLTSRHGLLLLGSLATLSLTACSGNEAETTANSIVIAASFYPIEEIVSNLSGGTIGVVGLTPPGAGAHDLELTSEQLTELEDSDVLFYLGDGFQPGIEKVMTSLPKSVQVVDLLERITVRDIVPQLEGLEGETDGESLESGKDPHVWLDPANMIIMANHVHDVLQDIQGIDKNSLDSSLNTYLADLTKLGSEFDDGLKQCESNVIVTSHRAFEYLAARTNLQQVAIAGVNPDSEPSTKSMQEIAKFAQANRVSTIFFETLLPEDLARTIANEIGAKTDLLDPIEGFSQDDLDAGMNYIVAQRANLERLRAGLNCK